MEYKKGKTQTYEKVKNQEYWINFFTNIIEAIMHGLTISFVVLLTLPNARFSDGRLFPVEALHFSIYFLLITVSIFRHMIYGQCSKFSIFVLAIISYPVLFGALWLMAAFDSAYHKMALQMGRIWTVYDSAFMIINAVTFCLACSLYIS